VSSKRVSLIPEEARAEAHLRIGSCLRPRCANGTKEADLRDRNQLNRGGPPHHLTGRTEKVAELNLIAGRRAKASSAYASALTYLTLARRCCGKTRGSACRTSPRVGSCTGPTVSSWTGALPSVEERLARLQRALSTRSSERPLAAGVWICTRCSGRATGVEVGLEFLRYVGIDCRPSTEMEARREYERFMIP